MRRLRVGPRSTEVLHVLRPPDDRDGDARLLERPLPGARDDHRLARGAHEL